MKLYYGGVVYSCCANSLVKIEAEKSRGFPGKSYRVRQPIYQPGQATLNLVYRGMAYSTGTRPTQQQAHQSSVPSEFVAKLSVQLGLPSQL